MSFSRTVDRELVHREALGEVFITDVTQFAGGEFRVGAQLPRLHAYYGDHLHHRPLVDPVLLLETARQAGLCLAHKFFAVPQDHKFILTRLDLRLGDLARLVIGPRPVELELRGTILDRKDRDGAVVGLDYRFQIVAEGHELGEAVVGLRFRSPQSYNDLRMRNRQSRALPSSASYRPALTGLPAQPRRVGRRDERNVVITEPVAVNGTVVADFRLPFNHPSMFDHPQDHLPGMVLAEAARQLAVAAVVERHGYAPEKMVLRAVSTRFVKFGELEPITRLVAVTGARGGAAEPEVVYTAAGEFTPPDDLGWPASGSEVVVLVDALQDGESICRFTVVMSTIVDGGEQAR
ncbi:ScbA/BarX family gamma-butyrolactone biosynthesis protein [Saccharothrix syringae]|uniref:ScbA/BarX family gamma-butyrolactone biosynthesis protein n=1 Tax=Saccharothrix syringae TaxID=103733 RepID=UPI002240EC01|nr:ScbA/BarX family gamma-butyrolactone biosynthesis protein [Saccharothrix syringae]